LPLALPCHSPWLLVASLPLSKLYQHNKTLSTTI
jgi:hypothetical protein